MYVTAFGLPDQRRGGCHHRSGLHHRQSADVQRLRACGRHACGGDVPGQVGGSTLRKSTRKETAAKRRKPHDAWAMHACTETWALLQSVQTFGGMLLHLQAYSMHVDMSVSIDGYDETQALACIARHVGRCSYMHTYIHICAHTHLHTYLPASLPTYLHTYITAYIPTYLHAYIPTYLPTYIHTYYIQIVVHIRIVAFVGRSKSFCCQIEVFSLSCFQDYRLLVFGHGSLPKGDAPQGARQVRHVDLLLCSRVSGYIRACLHRGLPTDFERPARFCWIMVRLLFNLLRRRGPLHFDEFYVLCSLPNTGAHMHELAP